MLNPSLVIARRTRFAVAVPLVLFAAARLAATDVAFKITDAKAAPVVDAVVSLVPLDVAGKIFAPPTVPLEISQKGQEFSPLVTPLVVGTAVNLPNRDTVQHQVYSRSTPKKFELPLYASQAKEPVVFDKAGVVVVGCNIHDWMLAYVVVLETPWFAKSAADGAAIIAAVPPGRYRAEVWHPTLKKNETREITVADGAAAIAFTIPAKLIPRIPRRPAGIGSGYK